MAKITNGVLQYRHPVAKDKKGKYGFVVNRGVAKFPPSEQGKILEDSDKLIALAPNAESEIDAASFHSFARACYFEPLDGETWLQRLQRNSPQTLNEWAEQLETGETSEVPELKQKIRGLEAMVETLRKELGRKSLSDEALTLQDCFAHYSKVFRPKKGSSVEHRNECIRRVETVLNCIGMKKTHSSMTAQIIDEGITASGAKSTKERYKRAVETKRFFKWVARPVKAGGLNLDNPAETLESGSVKMGKVVTLDPKILLAYPLTDSQKMIFALCGWAGMRLNEAAGLELQDIDFVNKIIHIRPNETRPHLKTEDGKDGVGSERAVPPFQNIWPMLEKYVQGVKGKSLFLKKAKKGKTPKTWFVNSNGRSNCRQLSTHLIEALKKKGPEVKAPNLKLRRFWSTSMKLAGLANIEDLLGGHSADVSTKSYTDKLALAMAVKMKAL